MELGNPITFEEIESAKKSNLKFGEIAGLEELLGDDGLFEESGVAEATEIVMECTCWGDEATAVVFAQRRRRFGARDTAAIACAAATAGRGIFEARGMECTCAL